MPRTRYTPDVPFDDRPFLLHAGVVLRERREALGWLQRDVGLKIGRSVSAVSALERGQAWMEPRGLLHYAYVVDAPPVLLFPPPMESVLQECITLLRAAPQAVTEAVCNLLQTGYLLQPPPNCASPLGAQS